MAGEAIKPTMCPLCKHAHRGVDHIWAGAAPEPEQRPPKKERKTVLIDDSPKVPAPRQHVPLDLLAEIASIKVTLAHIVAMLEGAMGHTPPPPHHDDGASTIDERKAYERERKRKQRSKAKAPDPS